MDFQSAQRALALAKKKSFREAFRSHAGETPPSLDDATIALVFTASRWQNNDDGMIVDDLPQACRDHFRKLHAMKTESGDFFTRFVLFAKVVDDGLLVGFGADDMYYVVATWDEQGCDLWQPEHDLHDRPVLA